MSKILDWLGRALLLLGVLSFFLLWSNLYNRQMKQAEAVARITHEKIVPHVEISLYDLVNFESLEKQNDDSAAIAYGASTLCVGSLICLLLGSVAGYKRRPRTAKGRNRDACS